MQKQRLRLPLGFPAASPASPPLWMPGRTVEGSMPSQMRISCKDKMSGPRELTVAHPVTVKSFKRWDEDAVEAAFLQGCFSTPRGLLEKEDSSSERCQWSACLGLGLRSHSMPPVPSVPADGSSVSLNKGFRCPVIKCSSLAVSDFSLRKMKIPN